MSSLVLLWNIVSDAPLKGIPRYCPGCGREVLFFDCHHNRENANGKNIHVFERYRCERGHTWSRKVARVNSSCRERVDAWQCPDFMPPEPVSLGELLSRGTDDLEIRLGYVEGTHRLDKVLARYISDMSRQQIVAWIGQGRILLDEGRAEPKSRLRSRQVIHIRIRDEDTVPGQGQAVVESCVSVGGVAV